MGYPIMAPLMRFVWVSMNHPKQGALVPYPKQPAAGLVTPFCPLKDRSRQRRPADQPVTSTSIHVQLIDD